MSGWKTLLFNVAGLVFALGEYFAAFPWGQVLTPQHAALVLAGFNILNIMLRHVTADAAGWRKELRR